MLRGWSRCPGASGALRCGRHAQQDEPMVIRIWPYIPRFREIWPIPNTREKRAAQVLRAAFRDVDLHGWQGSITEDACRLHLSGGSVTLDLGLGTSIARYIDAGVAG